MLTSLHIQRFRGFGDVRIEGFARFNLIVGRNDVGKTSLLDAIELLQLHGRSDAVFRGPSRRDEMVKANGEPAPTIRWLFPGGRVAVGERFAIQISGEPGDCEVSIRVPSAHGVGVGTPDVQMSSGALQIAWLERGKAVANQQYRVRLPAGGLEQAYEAKPSDALLTPAATLFVASGPGLSAQAKDRWRHAIDQDRVADLLCLLKGLDPRIRGVAALPEADLPAASAFVATLEGESAALPLGSLGDGAARLLDIGLAILTAKNAILIDEFDRGLHHGAMLAAWRSISRLCRVQGLQLFATTHSYECIQAAHEAFAATPDDLAVFRLDRSETGIRAVRYDAETRAEAFRREWEVRG
jgi:hypothetical protein